MSIQSRNVPWITTIRCKCFSFINIESLIHHSVFRAYHYLLSIVFSFYWYPCPVLVTLSPLCFCFSSFYSLKPLPIPLSTSRSAPNFPCISSSVTSPYVPHTHTTRLNLSNLTHSLLPYLAFFSLGVFGGFEADPLMCGAFQGAHLAIPAFVTALCCTTAYILLPPKLTTGTYFSYFLSCIWKRKSKGDAFTDSNNDLNGTWYDAFLH